MACISASGELTDSARKLLAALDIATTTDQVATHTGLPLYRVRSGLREMAKAGLVEINDGTYGITALGRSLLEPAT